MNSEPGLLQRVRRFDQEALAEAYDTYSPGIYRYAVRLLGDNVLAEEAVSETFSRFLVGVRNGQGPDEHLQAYLYRIAHNWITDYYRRQPPPTLPLDADMHADTLQDPTRLVHERLEQKRVRAALMLLTPEQRQVVVLRFLEDLSNEEVAAAMDKPVGSIKALQHRAVAALRRLLIRDEEKNL